MANLVKKGRVYALILMIMLSLGCVFYLSLNDLSNEPNIPFPQAQKHELLSLEEARNSLETTIRTSLQSLLDTWMGEQKSKVTVRAQMDFSEEKQTQEMLDLDNPAMTKAVGDEVEYTYAKKTSETTEKAGKIKRLSVTILVDSSAFNAQRQSDLRRLIENAAGLNLKRGDSLEIMATTFAPTPFFSTSVWSHSLSIFTIILLFVLFGVLMTKNALNAEQIETPPVVLPAFTNPASYASLSSPIDGTVAPNALKKAQNLLQSKPNESMTLLRSWLCQVKGDVNE